MKKISLFFVALACAGTLSAQELKLTIPEIHGTVRGKYEYQFADDEHRFQVRNARISFTGGLLPLVKYKAEIDLSDQGKMKMLDAFVNVAPWREVDFTIGQMRVPFSIDAHRSPHKRYFANRSFIAKQVGNVRDVGLALNYKSEHYPFVFQAGVFNGSGITEQKDWHKAYSYSTKLQFMPTHSYNLTLSMMKTEPANVAMYLYDAGTYVKLGPLHLEIEGLYKHYEKQAFSSVWAFNSFANYNLELGEKGLVKRISFLGRFDYMQDHSHGIPDKNGILLIDDYGRKRMTTGLTLGFGKIEQADLRLNFEKYFYRKGAVADPSEKDKIVVEMMFRF